MKEVRYIHLSKTSWKQWKRVTLVSTGHKLLAVCMCGLGHSGSHSLLCNWRQGGFRWLPLIVKWNKYTHTYTPGLGPVELIHPTQPPGRVCVCVWVCASLFYCFPESWLVTTHTNVSACLRVCRLWVCAHVSCGVSYGVLLPWQADWSQSWKHIHESVCMRERKRNRETKRGRVWKREIISAVFQRGRMLGAVVTQIHHWVCLAPGAE